MSTAYFRPDLAGYVVYAWPLVDNIGNLFMYAVTQEGVIVSKKAEFHGTKEIPPENALEQGEWRESFSAVLRRFSNQRKAQDALKAIANAENVHFERTGGQEYVTLGALVHEAASGDGPSEARPVLRELGDVDDAGVAIKSEYCFIVRLQNGGKTFVAYAWPGVKCQSANKMYAVTENGLIREKPAQYGVSRNPSAGEIDTDGWVPVNQTTHKK